ncbi:hypothetical protein LB505_013454 [Fusarium chuoi]|nr:hypothetical protein LB505_013454 [Fusarium chuoi]
MASNAEKLACESCIRGHRVAKCQHTEKDCDEGETCKCAHKTDRRNKKRIQSPLSTDKSSTPSTALSPSESEDRTAESPTPARSCCAPSSTPSHDAAENMGLISTTNLGIASAWNSSDVLDPWNASVLDSLPERFSQGLQNLTETWDQAPDLGYGPAFMGIPTFGDPLSTADPFDASSLFNDIDISQIHIPDEWVVNNLTINEPNDPKTQPNNF